MPGTSVLFRDGNEGLGPLLFLKGGLANTALNYSPFPGFCVFMIPLFVCVHYSFFCMFIIHFFCVFIIPFSMCSIPVKCWDLCRTGPTQFWESSALQNKGCLSREGVKAEFESFLETWMEEPGLQRRPWGQPRWGMGVGRAFPEQGVFLEDYSQPWDLFLHLSPRSSCFVGHPSKIPAWLGCAALLISWSLLSSKQTGKES